MPTLGIYEWSTTRGNPSGGQITLASDPIPGYPNTLRVSETDREGNDRMAALGTVAEDDQLRITAAGLTIRLLSGTPADSGSFRSYPVVLGRSFDEPLDEAEVTLLSRTPVAWPDTEELAQVVNVDNVEDWQTTLNRVLASAISTTKSVIGSWDDAVDAPTDNQAAAALRMGELMSERPNATVTSLIADAAFRAHLTGQRRRFGVA